MGAFGNSNPHFETDWILATQDPSVNSPSAALTGTTSSSCVLTAAMNIDIFMNLYGTTKNP